MLVENVLVKELMYHKEAVFVKKRWLQQAVLSRFWKSCKEII